MTDRQPPPIIPNTAVVHISDLERMASSAAEQTAAKILKEVPSRDEMREIAEEAIEGRLKNLLLRLGIDLEEEGAVKETRDDLVSLRRHRKLMEAIGRHGILAAVGICVSGIGYAIWFAIRGVRP